MKITEIDTNNITKDIIKRVLFNIPKSEYDYADYAIVFGCHLKPLLDERIKCAIDILKTKKINKVILSGGVGVYGDFDESKYMMKRILNEGIDIDKILTESESSNTEDNIENSLKILEKNNLKNGQKIVLVSNEGHLRKIGMEIKKKLSDFDIEIIYEYPSVSVVSFDNIKDDANYLKIATDQIKKIIYLINEGIIDDEEIDL